MLEKIDLGKAFVSIINEDVAINLFYDTCNVLIRAFGLIISLFLANDLHKKLPRPLE